MIDGTSVASLLPSGAMMLATNHRPGATLVLQIMRGPVPMTIWITAGD